MALDFSRATASQVAELVEVTDDLVIVGILVDLSWAVEAGDKKEKRQALDALFEYLMLDFVEAK